MPKSQLQRRRTAVSPKKILGAIVALLVVFILFTSVIGLTRKYLGVQKRVRALKEQEALVLEKQQNLKKITSYMETPAGEEYELRSKYNIVRPGEEVIIISEAEKLPEEESKTIVGRWWESILKGLGLRKEK